MALPTLIEFEYDGQIFRLEETRDWRDTPAWDVRHLTKGKPNLGMSIGTVYTSGLDEAVDFAKTLIEDLKTSNLELVK